MTARTPVTRTGWWKAALVVIACGGAAVTLGFLYANGSGDTAAQDLQPLAFSHQLHAGRLEVSCLFCHRSPEVSPVAGVPSMQLCMGCHRNLSGQTAETEKLLGSWQERLPVRWTRLHRLPDFVYFTHEMHLHRGLQCVQCHGRVEDMTYTPRAASFEMGWCLSCHRRQDGPLDCLACHK